MLFEIKYTLSNDIKTLTKIVNAYSVISAINMLMKYENNFWNDTYVDSIVSVEKIK